MNKEKVLIIGAGVSGLSSGILLLQSGFKVEIWAKDMPEDTTSNIAAAFWYPYLCNPREKVIGWSKDTLNYLKQNALPDENSGVKLMMLTEYLDEKSPDPWWRPAVEELSRPQENELPPGYKDGYRTRVMLMDTTKYLPWLVKRLEASGVYIKQRIIKSFDEAFADFDIVINCSGLGAKELCDDDSLYPVRGQVLIAEPNGFDQVVCDDSGHNNVAYIVPRANDVVLGGTAQKDNWNLEIDPDETKEILRKAAAVAPFMGEVKVLQERVGLRPGRDEVRLEIEEFGDKKVVHNYGHGGAGFTLSWGCAKEVTQLVGSI